MADTGSKSNRLFLVVAIVIGVLSVGMAFVYISQARGRWDPKKGKQVLVVKREIPANATLNLKTDIEVLSIPGIRKFDAFVNSCIPPSLSASLDGKRVSRALPKGTPVTYADLVAPVDLALTEGMIAISIPAKPATAVGGLLATGDQIGLFFSIPVKAEEPATPANVSSPPNANSSQLQAQLTNQMLQAMYSGMASSGGEVEIDYLPGPYKVVAVGQRLDWSRQQFVMFEGTQGQADMGSLTLEVTAEQAKEILKRMAVADGTPTVALIKKTGN